MSDSFGGGGGFNSGGSWKSNVDNYYTYTQTSGGGGGGCPSGGKGCGTVPSTIIIVILVAVAIQNIVAALIVIGSIGLIGLIIYLILKQQAITNQKKNELLKQRNTNGVVTIEDYLDEKEIVITVAIEPNTITSDKSYTESIPIAGNGSNLAVFRITVPKAGSYVRPDHDDPEMTNSDTLYGDGL